MASSGDYSGMLEGLLKVLKSHPDHQEDEFQAGYQIAKSMVGMWNKDTDMAMAYVYGRRVHHGMVGAVLELLGVIIPRPYLSVLRGAAYALIEDDVDDILEWFDFERGGDPERFVSLVKSYDPGDRGGRSV